eukprot:TRINITY_DN635_c0_g1_i1.p1 TRINITY_DN635_c0_g1~~TRINITY_DN635_c0_g1_i1.p1  ORF type:complete len:135 (+),score=4.68 TRINITY_DN635_c0_g1_i1:28-405(+)
MALVAPFWSQNHRINFPKSLGRRNQEISPVSLKTLSRVSPRQSTRRRSSTVKGSAEDSNQKIVQDEEVTDLGVKAALSLLKFYKKLVLRQGRSRRCCRLAVGMCRRAVSMQWQLTRNTGLQRARS